MVSNKQSAGTDTDQVLDRIRQQMAQTSQAFKFKKSIPTEEILDERYDRMQRKEFARKPDSFPPILFNDGYSNFRFTKRAGDVLSPLNKSKFGFNDASIVRKQLRKMTLNPNLRTGASSKTGGNQVPKMSETVLTIMGGNKTLRDNSFDVSRLRTMQKNTLAQTQQNFKTKDILNESSRHKTTSANDF